MGPRWRLLPFDAGPSERHVAQSDALVRWSERPTVWWHTTTTPTLILGAAQSEDEYRERLAASSLVALVRRHAGGTAVFADAGVLGLDVVLPRDHPLASRDVVESYRWLGETWVEALARLGVESSVVSIDEARADRPAPADLARAIRIACFGTLSPYEVVSGNRKLVGLAQVRRRNVLLQSGLHLRFDAAMLARLLAPELAEALSLELRRRAVGLDEVLTTPLAADAIIEAFAAALEKRYDVRLESRSWSAQELNWLNR